MVGYPTLWVVVGAYFFASVARSHLGLSGGGAGLVLLGLLGVVFDLLFDYLADIIYFRLHLFLLSDKVA